MAVDDRAPARTSLAAVIAAVAWSALILQLWLLLAATRDTLGPGLALLRFFSYFTVLSNILVALAASFALAGPSTSPGLFFAKARVRAGIALYIAATFAVYLLILRHLWQPQGTQWWADVGLHYATPALYLTWFALQPRGRLRWRDIPYWLVFPLLFLGWALLRGAWLGEYPYPFIDVAALGWPAVLANAAGLCMLFALLGVLLVAQDRLGAKRTTYAPAPPRSG